jgi:hypothetical protein
MRKDLGRKVEIPVRPGQDDREVPVCQVVGSDIRLKQKMHPGSAAIARNYRIHLRQECLSGQVVDKDHYLLTM